MSLRRRPSPPFLRPGALLLAAAVMLAAALAQAPAAAAQAAPRAALSCDQNTVLTLAGVDTLEGRLLLRSAGGWLLSAAPSASDPGGAGWAETATYEREPEGRRPYGFSVGPGPLFAVTDCGRGCLQAVRWASGAWEPLGEPLRGAPTAAVHATWDLAGSAWLVLQAPLPPGDGPKDGVRAWAWRLQDGVWVAAGGSVARSSGAAAAVPDPTRPDAVLSGTLRFAVGAEPAAWVPSLPALAAEQVGVLVPVRGGAAYLTADGRLLLSRDGERWVRSRWTPWRTHPTRLYTPGKDFNVDLPTGDRRGDLEALWVDRRGGESGQLYLTSWSPAADWQALADLAPTITTLNGDRLGYGELVVTSPGTWVLLTGCVNTANGPGLVLRTHGPQGLTRPRFLPLRPVP